MRAISIFATALAAFVAVAAPASAAPGPLGDFRLPPDSRATQPPPDRQGPVAPDVPESRRAPAADPSPAPEPAAPPPPVVVPPTIAETPDTPRQGRAPPVPPSAPARLPVAPTAPSPQAETPVAVEPALTFPSPAEPAAPTGTDAIAANEKEGPVWPWALGALLALGGLAFAGRAWRQREVGGIPIAIPEIERPRINPAPRPAKETATPAPAGDAPAAEPLHVTLEPLRLSLTLMNAALSYRLEIANHGPVALTGLEIGADMISAHASMSREEQLSGPGAGAVAVQRIERLEPGESTIVSGEFRLPFPRIVPIRQGDAALLLPLARFRVAAESTAPLTRTFMVGQPGSQPGAGLQPFRLDLGPRVYPRLEQRAFG